MRIYKEFYKAERKAHYKGFYCALPHHAQHKTGRQQEAHNVGTALTVSVTHHTRQLCHRPVLVGAAIIILFVILTCKSL